MKETVFRFELRIDPANPENSFQGLTAKLATLSGVLAIKSELSENGISLSVHVSFADSEHAKRLHRKILNKIIGHEGVTILQVKTKLTDIF